MRNLKKFLALVMAMVMAFSLMLTVNAANPVKTFDDAGSIEEKFVEAADVLTGMKVFQGDGDGFYPARNITRAEVAALIYRLATGDVDNSRAQLYANYGNFTDVNESDWFAGYVGYCANAGYIKGRTATTFDPYGQVTGYETLAMILRAIGYDKNGEFTGATWQTNVSALATQLGILENIKTTHYGDTLYLASRRDVVAELLFQADAKVPMVTYTTAFGYQNTGMTGGVVGSTTNPTLGLYIFGLTNDTGIIVGNQETGERVTILGRAGSRKYTSVNGAGTAAGPEATASWTDYNYPGTSVVDGYNVWDAAASARADAAANDGDTTGDITVNNSLFLDYKSGIDVFGYKTKFWYNGGENDGTKMGTRDNPRKVYASFDKHEADKIVYAGDADLDGANAVGLVNQSLGKMVTDSGMKMRTNAAGTDNQAIFNNAFDRMTRSHHTTTNYGDTGAGSPNNLYKIISNSTNADKDKMLDLVVELNIQSSKITGVDSVSSFKYVTAETSGTDYLPATNILTTTGFIAQAALVGDSTKTLGANEIGWHITGTWSQDTVADGGRRNVDSAAGTEGAIINTLTNAGTAATASKAYFKLGAVATKEGAVSSYHNHTANVPGTGWVVLNDGTKLNQSVLYNTVQANTIPQQSTVRTANDQEYGSMTYRFYLDAEGKYIGAEPIVGTEFVYGTYIDFESNLGTSTYTYRLVGVNMDGEMVTKDVKKYGTGAFNGTMTAIGAGGAELDAIGVPFRGDSSYTTTSVTGVQPGLYTGYAVNSVGNMTDDTDNTSGTNLAIPMYTDNDATNEIFDATVTINKTATTLGAVKAGDDANADGTDTDPIYFTEATKFVLVKGTGTDSQKVSVYNGITELLGANRTVTINFDGDPTASYFETAGTEEYRDMTVFSMSDFVYAQDNTGTPKQADVVFIPEAAVDGVGSALHYVGNATPLLVNAYGEDATKFAMYVDGEREEIWIRGLVDDTQVAGPTRTSATIVAFGATAGTDTVPDNHDQFYNLTDTGLKATDGQPIYTVTAVPATYTSHRADASITIGTAYIATTMNSQTATICDDFDSKTTYTGALYRVADAKVVNLNATGAPAPLGYYWPGITDLSTLNQASSLNNITTQVPVKVSCVLSGDNLTAEVIYVCYDQNTPR